MSRSLDSLESLISDMKKASTEMGAIAIFIGVVRGTHQDEKILRLEYETHKTYALEKFKQIIMELKDKYEITDAAIEHKLGTVKTGEDIMYVLVASKHRKASFQALTEIIERIKHEVPIWKKEITEKGTYWIENPR